MREQNRQKRKSVLPGLLSMSLLFFVGVGMGIAGSASMARVLGEEASFFMQLLYISGLLLAIYIAFVIQVIIHEAGHLVGGLMSGYSFCSFRIFRFMWIKENGRLTCKRLSLTGTGGQCLLAPPEIINGHMPVVLYHLGGVLMNTAAALFFGGLFFVFRHVPFLSTVLLLLAIAGLLLTFINGVPMHMNGIDNDGYNTLSLKRHPEAVHSFWAQMKITEELSRGKRLKDLPETWFWIPTDEEMKNSMNAAAGVFFCNRLMDAQRFDEADTCMAHLLEIDSGMADIHRRLMTADRLYCELIGSNRAEILPQLLTKQQIQFMKSMKAFPSVLRTGYAYALLQEKDPEKAAIIQERFEKVAQTYPYAGDIQGERELIAFVRQRTCPDISKPAEA